MAGMNEKLQRAQSWVHGTLEYLQLKKRSESAIAFAKERPVVATLIGVAVATSFLPAVAFVSFVVTFLVIGILSLLFIEGAAILSAGVILLMALVGCMMATGFIGTLILGGLVVGRFSWRMASPLRAKIASRLGMGTTDNKATMAAEEKGQQESDYLPDLGLTGKAGVDKTD